MTAQQKTREGSSAQVKKKLFTVEEYHRAVEAGVFDEGNKVELIEGEIYPMAAMGSRHAACVRRLDAILNRLAQGRALVSTQCPVFLHDNSEPEPDVALLKPREDFYESGHPKPSDILLAVEVSDTTLRYDTQIKLPVYATAGVPEVWLVDLNSDTIQLHSNPATGEYRNTLRVKRGESFRSDSLSGAEVAANAILG